MKPAWALARKAQSAPNSAGSPNRPTGIRAFESARAVSTLTFRCAAVRARPAFCRSVSNDPGWIELMVTLWRANSRAAEARNAVKPARAPDETSRPAIGALTELEVTLMIRPNLRSAMPGASAWTRAIGVSMFDSTPLRTSSRVIWSSGLNGGPPLLLTRMSASGQAAISSARVAGSSRSPRISRILTPVASRSSRPVRASASASRPLRTMAHPASASARAQARPKPLLDAQTIALRPAIPRSMPHVPTLDTAKLDNYKPFACAASSKRHENLRREFLSVRPLARRPPLVEAPRDPPLPDAIPFGFAPGNARLPSSSHPGYAAPCRGGHDLSGRRHH